MVTRAPAERFFDDHPQFYATSQTGADADRLHDRYRAIVEFNHSVFPRSRVLDIASHDGRWSFASLHAGAEHVTGIEVRPYLVDYSNDNMRRENIAADRYRFICGDALEEIARLPAGQFDVVLCLGYLYHTVHLPLLIQQIGRLKPRHVIVDTQLGIPVGVHEPPEWLALSAGIYGTFFMERLCQFLSAQPLILLHEDDTEKEGMAVTPGSDASRVPVGYPTKGALEFLLSDAGFGAFTYYDWLTASLSNAVPSFDYRMGYRVTMRCSART
jgi:SAM-dependent methyltransferase